MLRSDPQVLPTSDPRMRLLLLLLTLLPLVACGDAEQGAVTQAEGLVILNEDPADPRRPYFLRHGSARARHPP